MIGRLYGIRPWEIELLTVAELEAIDRELAAMRRDAAKRDRKRGR